MKAYVVKAKAKYGKLPSKEICRDLLYEDSFERKIDIIRNNNSEIPNVNSKKDLEIYLSNKLYDDIHSFLKFLKGEEKNFFLKYISSFEVQLMQLIVQAIINDHLTDSLDIIKREKFSHDINVSKNDDFKSFIEKSKSSRYYRTLFPFLNENMERDSIIFLISNALNKFYYRDLLDECKKLPKKISCELRDFIGRKIDIFNIEMLFRLKNYFVLNDYEIFNYLIEGGKGYNANKLKMISNLSMDDFFEYLDGTKYKNIFDNAWDSHIRIMKMKMKLSRDEIIKERSTILYVISAMMKIYTNIENLVSLLEVDESFTLSERYELVIVR